MKIMFYIGSILRPGGAERVMSNLVNHFHEKGDIVLLVTDCNYSPKYIEYPLNHKIKRYNLDSESTHGKLKNIVRLYRLRKATKKFCPDVIISFMGPPNIRMLISSIGIRCKKIVSVRNDPYSEYGCGVRQWFTNIVFLLSDGIICQTKKVYPYFGRVNQNRIKVIVNPIEKNFFDTEWVGDQKTIVCVGRLESQKNQELLLQAFTKIYRKVPSYMLMIYGDGSLKNYLEQRSNEMGIKERTVFCGEVENIEDILARAGLFVLPSDFEGMPNALMEAMAVGVPCISTDCPVGGPAALMKGSMKKYLVACGDSNELAEKILSVLKLSEKERKCISSKIQKCAKTFSPDIVYGSWEDYLTETIGK